MFKMTLLTLFLFSTLQVFAPERTELIILFGEKICPYERLYYAICMVESSNNPLAFHMEENGFASVGIVQIQQSRLDDFNKRQNKQFKLSDCYDKGISREIWTYYATLYHYSQIEEISRCWNGGPNGMTYKQTLKYYQLVKKFL